ncbi:MAG: Spy/CpxP family protein refolding chaperone [Candidatus Omnitrophica bacterium]|nr:Spy/CpxP family protein refolding chaperone [Candidatus Omnitrophota bacterium]
MDKEIRYFLIGLAIFLILTFNIKVFAFDGEKKYGYRQKNMEELINSLNLTQEQKEKMEQLRTQNRQNISDIKKQLKDLRKQLKLELDKDQLDEAKIKDIANQIQELQAKILDLRINNTIQFRKTLTPQQYEIFKEKIKERQQQKETYRNKRSWMKERRFWRWKE